MFNECHFFHPYLSDIAYSTFFYKGQHSRIHIRDYYIVAYTISAEHLALEKKLDSHNHCSVSTENLKYSMMFIKSMEEAGETVQWSV